MGPAAGGVQQQIMALAQKPCYFVFWFRDPQKAKNWLDYQKKLKVALDYSDMYTPCPR